MVVLHLYPILELMWHFLQYSYNIILSCAATAKGALVNGGVRTCGGLKSGLPKLIEARAIRTAD